jgi:hypothetical protein
MTRLRHSGRGLDRDLPTYECNLEYRPDSYWEVPASIYANIKGTKRRRLIAAATPDGPGGPPPAEVFKDSLDESLRDLLGSVHPSLMGGEYLPDYARNEVEIARIDHDSVMGDVISVRARRTRDGVIHYRVVDDCGMPTYVLKSSQPSTSPLSLGELIELIETTEIFDGDSILHLCYELSNGGFEARGLVVPTWREQFIRGGDAKRSVAYCQVSSSFYPDLERWYGRHAEGWIAERESERGEDDEDCEDDDHEDCLLREELGWR